MNANAAFLFIVPVITCFCLFGADVRPEEHLYGSQELRALMDRDMMQCMSGMYGAYPASRESSGTSWQPDSTPFQGIMRMDHDRMCMIHGFVNGVYDRQDGPRGGEKTFIEGMFSFMGHFMTRYGTFGFRSMFSPDPLMGSEGYPLLLQTGETADGKTPLIDRQHPHDFFSELAITYSHTFAENDSLFVYVGLPGEPAVGPPVYTHRFTAMFNPEAPITHHWFDSTHITFGVATLGYTWMDVKFEGSVFNGREPDQNRWDIDPPAFNSYSGRLSYNPLQNWAFQASYAWLNSPEQLEPGTNIGRYTATAMYNREFGSSNWQTMAGWGRNDKKPGPGLNAFILESAVQIRAVQTVFARFENVEKDELFTPQSSLFGKTFTVGEVSIGYLYNLAALGRTQWGIGGTVSVSLLPGELKPVYGDLPVSYLLFARLALL